MFHSSIICLNTATFFNWQLFGHFCLSRFECKKYTDNLFFEKVLRNYKTIDWNSDEKVVFCSYPEMWISTISEIEIQICTTLEEIWKKCLRKNCANLVFCSVSGKIVAPNQSLFCRCCQNCLPEFQRYTLGAKMFLKNVTSAKTFPRNWVKKLLNLKKKSPTKLWKREILFMEGFFDL